MMNFEREEKERRRYEEKYGEVEREKRESARDKK